MSESIVKNEDRIGNFTSSEIYKLVKFGSRPMTELELKEHKEKFPKSKKKNIEDGFSDGGMTYIRHKAQELMRKRSMSLDIDNSATVWGDLMEMRVFELIGLEYQMTNKSTIKHPKINGWSGSTDLFIPGYKVSEIKAFQPENFCDYADILLQEDVSLLRETRPKEYWQIVSNSEINQVSKGEAILYMPYDSEAKEIEEMLSLFDGYDQTKYFYIYNHLVNGDLHKLPFQPNNSGYPNIILFEFDIPQEDKDFIEKRVQEAIKLRDILFSEMMK